MNVPAVIASSLMPSIIAGFRSAAGIAVTKILVHLRETAPVVEVRSLAAYENAAAGVRP